ncbi:MAG: glycosidase, partial [Bacteroidota bacterium]
FQFSDGWWKFGQTKNLDVHDNNASWANGGYSRDLAEGENNMNEEWFGVCAKGPTNERGLYELFPRAAYYALKDAHSLNPYASGVSLESVNNHFSNIQLMDAVIQARGDKAALVTEELKKIRFSNFRADLSTFYTGGSLISTPEDPNPNQVSFPDEQGFDHMQSFFFGVEARPSENFRAKAEFNVLGNVAQNPIDEIFYENRGRPVTVETPDGRAVLGDANRMQLYRASFNWKGKIADVDGFYRTGHYHWGYEGDFFGLYPEANYGPNIDIYNGNAPFGVEVTGKKELKGLKVAFGPELWWAANPAVLVKYSRHVLGFDATAIFHEDIDRFANTVSSFAIPMPLTRRFTLHLKREIGPLGFEIGGIWGGQPLVGRSFQLVDNDVEVEKMVAYEDQVNNNDTWGGKVKLMYSKGPFRWYGQAAAMGLVANGGADLTRTYTGWRLKDSGSGNQMNFLSGFTLRFGNLEIGPNFLWQKPLVGPVPGGLDAPARPRNILEDPFVVRGNREQIAGEILFTWDPTPGTWMYEWDNDFAEDAPFAISAGFVYRHLPTTQDAAIGILADGRSIFAFPGAPDAQDLWEAHTRIVSKFNPELGLIANLYGGTVQANGSDQRLIERVGGDVRLIYKNFKMEGMVKVNDWGPFDYHRDFNLTFPLQLALDISTSLGKPSWIGPSGTRMGLRYAWRSLDEFSNRYCPGMIMGPDGTMICDPTAPGDNGSEWEFRTYIQVNIGN